MSNKDISNMRFGRLVAIKPVGKDKYHQTLWLCKCDCGKECTTNTNRLCRGKTKSCGCLKNEGNNLKHGMCYSRLWRIYSQMKGRCYRKSHERYLDYGGRGITICNEWMGDSGFQNFVEWALSHGYSDNLTIDRINNDKEYSPENCRWADRKTQGRNTRRNHLLSVDGKTKTMAEWSEETGIHYSVIMQRINKLGWSAKDVVTKEVKHHGEEICVDRG